MLCSFTWEEGSACCRLLVVGSQFNLRLLEVEAKLSASISLLCVCECPAERLLQAVRGQDHGESID